MGRTRGGYSLDLERKGCEGESPDEIEAKGLAGHIRDDDYRLRKDKESRRRLENEVGLT